MAAPYESIRWAPKVAQEKIRRLYRNDAAGLADEELIDEVAYGLYARCESILTVTDAHFGKVKCPACGRIILGHGTGAGKLLRCGKCSWRLPWEDYHRSYQKKQLFGGNATEVFREFHASFQLARTAGKRMRWIDQLIHKFHYFLEDRTRTVSANLIQGGAKRTLELLNELTYGSHTSPEARATYAAWRKEAARDSRFSRSKKP